jgi:hypothetical protein
MHKADSVLDEIIVHGNDHVHADESVDESDRVDVHVGDQQLHHQQPPCLME